jgi:hypothetical protein
LEDPELLDDPSADISCTSAWMVSSRADKSSIRRLPVDEDAGLAGEEDAAALFGETVLPVDEDEGLAGENDTATLLG